MSISKYPNSPSYLSDLPVGSIIPWPSDSLPAGWINANGAAVSRTVYSEFFNQFGTTWGVGDGSTTFNIPFSDPVTLPWNAPRGRIAFQQRTTTSPTFSTQTDLGVSVTVTFYANRRYRITAHASTLVGSSVANEEVNFMLVDHTGGVQLQQSRGSTPSTGKNTPGFSLNWTGSFAAGSRTIKLTGSAVTGTSAFFADAFQPIQLIVEDLGADTSVSPYSIGEWIVKMYDVQYTEVSDSYQIVTSSTRPGSPTAGLKIWETDTERELVYSGTEWKIIGGKMPAVHIYKASGIQGVTQHAFTTITMDGETIDTDGFHDNVTNNTRITIPAGCGGRYLVNGRCGFDIASTGTIAINIQYNGTTSLNSAASVPRSDGGGSALNISTVVELTAGSYIELQGYQNGLASGVNYPTGSGVTFLSAVYLGPS